MFASQSLQKTACAPPPAALSPSGRPPLQVCSNYTTVSDWVGGSVTDFIHVIPQNRPAYYRSVKLETLMPFTF